MDAALVASALAAAVGGCGRPNPPHVELRVETQRGDATRIEVVAMASSESLWRSIKADDAQLYRLLALRQVGAPETAPIIGQHRRVGNELRFVPAFPVLLGVEYETRFDPVWLPNRADASLSVLTVRYRAPAQNVAPAPRLVGIFPTVDVLPANHLKFYVLFSEPMRRGNALQYFQLTEDGGRDVPESFRETELWSPDGRRLTLWFHPGRQKTGVNLNVEIGPVLERGHRYRLRISGAWMSEEGVPLGHDEEKQFTAGPPDHTQPSPAEWKLLPPRPGTSDPVRLVFSEPMDWAEIDSQIRIVNLTSELEGMTEVPRDGMSWAYRPNRPWRAGGYRIAIGTAFEDLAGNSIARPFEVDVTARTPAAIPEKIFLDFQVDGAGGKK